MTVDTVFEYIDESARLSKEIATFLKRRHAVELEYAKSLARITQSLLKQSSAGSLVSSTIDVNTSFPDLQTLPCARSSITNSTLWAAFVETTDQTLCLARAHEEAAKDLQVSVIEPYNIHIKDLESTKKMYFTSGQEHNRNVRSAFQAMRKAKKDMDSLEVAAIDSSQNFQRAQYNPGTKEKDLAKFAIKATTAQDKADHAKDTFVACEIIAKAAEEDYYGRFLPELYMNLRHHEEERCTAAKSVLEKANALGMKVADIHINSVKEAAQKISSIDIQDDIEAFSFSHMTQQEDREMVKNFYSLLPGELKRGTLHIRRDDMSVSWKFRVAIFRQDQHTLYLHDISDMTRPKETISIESCSVYSIDSSAVGKPAFQIIYSEGENIISYTCVAETELVRDDWAEILKRYARCCTKCAALSGFSLNTRRNENLVSKSSIKYRRTLSLRIIEAKDLRSSSGFGTISPYCLVLLDDVNFARTTTKQSETAIWTETFTFNDLAAHFGKLSIVVINRNFNSKDATIGYVTINLQSLLSGVKVDQWHQIKQLHEDGTVGSIRIACTLVNEQILPSATYEKFLELLTEPSFIAVKTLGRIITQERDEFARSFLNLMRSLNRDREGICMLIYDEISMTEDPNIIFRGNTMATKSFDQYMKIVGADFLQITLTPLIKSVYDSGESCETDPTRLDSSDSVRKNMKRLLQFVFYFWECIQKSVDIFPRKIVEIFAFIKEHVSKRFVDQQSRGEHIKYPSISGFLFLRFFCPAIISPHQFGLASEAPIGNVPRTLTLIAKILQNMANLTELKDPYLNEVNVFIKGQKDAMRGLLERVSTLTIDLDSPLDAHEPDTDVDRYCESIYQFFERYSGSLAATNKVPEYEKLAAAIQVIKNAHDSHSSEMTEFGESCKRNEDDERGNLAQMRLDLDHLSRALPPPPPQIRIPSGMGGSISISGDALATTACSPLTSQLLTPQIPPRSDQRAGGGSSASRPFTGESPTTSATSIASTHRTGFPTTDAAHMAASVSGILHSSPFPSTSSSRQDSNPTVPVRSNVRPRPASRDGPSVFTSSLRKTSAVTGPSLAHPNMSPLSQSFSTGSSSIVETDMSPLSRLATPLRYLTRKASIAHTLTPTTTPTTTPTPTHPSTTSSMFSPSRSTAANTFTSVDAADVTGSSRIQASAPRIAGEPTTIPFSVDFDSDVGSLLDEILPHCSSSASPLTTHVVSSTHTPSRSMVENPSGLNPSASLMPPIPRRTHSSGVLIDLPNPSYSSGPGGLSSPESDVKRGLPSSSSESYHGHTMSAPLREQNGSLALQRGPVPSIDSLYCLYGAEEAHSLPLSSLMHGDDLVRRPSSAASAIVESIWRDEEAHSLSTASGSLFLSGDSSHMNRDGGLTRPDSTNASSVPLSLPISRPRLDNLVQRSHTSTSSKK
ncbi:hypothetical protein BASA62_004394 [Batrachochytrium salamandrivorans]|nr:hypothetical protein BASA62_004394 [Batrachochytrium salamandrivorans]